jgi:hypothetical protein
MAKIDTYREKVRQIIAGYAQRLSSSGNDELETVFDTANDQYDYYPINQVAKSIMSQLKVVLYTSV